ncbi:MULTISPECIES: oxygen-independent coproporphyrinogen III oxidase [unclassified Spirosoma]|uniref:oxygen-independent coproporphyrinogen III oxidase n=1 Tax=unclassified Spirosoma TaxID=2621999 RepID=UPI000959274B|nr:MULTISPECIES: oxygen-independent coproporphyrinogen III oxidase [unclassified Spirosoma]MBN8825883.1 oxygen-independent coproporphyrinogen III oxidase [Spirosoma sp.]OJW70572.1 MAG: oxygen-independent coproporphyrinogen III oxidase [Spirosoma sp. 48-14]
MQLIQKYNVPGPRYTSYPTVPFWDETTFSETAWIRNLRRAFAVSNGKTGISLYIHLPYCESLCTFCGCNKRITKNHGVESPYIDALLAEWNSYCDLLPEKSRIAELHLGGGTPSFFTPDQLKRLLTGIFSRAVPTDSPDYGWEGHPNNTTREHLQVLYDFGFRRVSFGIQDYDPVVQKAIHRIQPVENVKRVTDWAREIGYTSVSHDLVFGLPFQTTNSIIDMIYQTLILRPDRIAFYSYAHVPWIKGNGQRGFRDDDLPSGEQKRILYETGRALLEDGGYVEIGMDHFARPHDALYKSMEAGTLHRNFMGYTTAQTQVLIGLGASSIGDVWTAFAQNEKDVDLYMNRVLAGELPLLRGHVLDDQDQFLRRQILNIMCKGKTNWHLGNWSKREWEALEARLEAFWLDGLIDYTAEGLQVRPEGRPFLRNICMAFDERLNYANPQTRLFSQTV